MSKIIKKISIVITVLLFLLAFYIMIFGTIARRNNQLLSFFGYSYSFVPTDSMEGSNEDSFSAGSLVISKKTKFDDLKIGDIIIYQGKASNNSEILIVHRIVEKNSDGTFITKGDNNSAPDSVEIDSDIYQAKVVNSFKLFDFGAKFVTYQLQILFVLIIFLTGFTIYQGVNIVKAIKNEKLEKIKEEDRLRKEALKEELKKEIEEEL